MNNPCALTIDPLALQLLPTGVPLGIQVALINALGANDDEITLEASLQSDLGADSVAMLDIIFKLEKTYELKIRRIDLSADDILIDPLYVDPITGRFNDRGITALQERMPYADLTKFRQNPLRNKFFDKGLTVGLLRRYLEHRGLKFIEPTKT